MMNDELKEGDACIDDVVDVLPGPDPALNK
jgi:hypothetical protein